MVGVVHLSLSPSSDSSPHMKSKLYCIHRTKKPFIHLIQVKIMSYQEEGDVPSSDSSDSDLHPLPTPGQKPKRIQIRERCKVWKFVDVIQVEVGERDQQQNTASVRSQISDRLQIQRPSYVTSITIFCDSSLLSGLPDAMSLAVIGYVQFSQASTLSSLRNWIASAAWNPVKNGLAGDTEFTQNMQRSENKLDPWIRMAVSGDIGLCNQARAAAKEDKKVCVDVMTTADTHYRCITILPFIHSCFESVPPVTKQELQAQRRAEKRPALRPALGDATNRQRPAFAGPVTPLQRARPFRPASRPASKHSCVLYLPSARPSAPRRSSRVSEILATLPHPSAQDQAAPDAVFAVLAPLWQSMAGSQPSGSPASTPGSVSSSVL